MMMNNVVVHRLVAKSLWATWHLVGTHSFSDVAWWHCS